MRTFLIVLFLIPVATVMAQHVEQDTLYLEGGGVLYGDVSNYPPDDVVDFRNSDGTHFRMRVKSVNAIYPASYKRMIPTPYMPSPAIATGASMVIPGLGLVISGHPRGFLYMGIGAGAVLITAVGVSTGNSLEDVLGAIFVGFAIYVVDWVVSMFDTPFAVAGMRDNLKKVYPYRFHSFDRQAPSANPAISPQSTSLSFSIPLQ